MNELVLIVPKNGAKVRDPETKEYLKQAGEVKPKSLYYLRRAKEGDVEILPVETKTLTKKEK